MTEIKIDVSDWEDEYMQAEPNLGTVEAAIEAQQSDEIPPIKMGRLLAIAKLRGMAYDGAPEHKAVHNVGWAYHWSQVMARRYERVRLESGREIEVRSLVAPVPAEDGGDEFNTDIAALDSDRAMQPWNNPIAVDRAERYLEQRIPGYIYRRLSIIAANRGDVEGAVQRLHEKIDEIAGQLV